MLKGANDAGTYTPTGKKAEKQEGKGDIVKWTLFQQGWCMEYLLPPGKSYRKVPEGEFPIDIERWRYEVRRTGEEIQSFTMARDVARAVMRLLITEREWVSWLVYVDWLDTDIV